MTHEAPAPLAAGGELTHRLAQTCLGLGFDDLSDADIEQLEKLLLDHLGVASRGCRTPWAAALTRWAEPYRGSGGATVLGSDILASAAGAAFVNASAAHGLELDDTHDESVSHPGAPVIAAALALAQQHGLSGRALLPAIAAGYETIGRIGAATGADAVIVRGFHPTSLFSGFGVAAAAAHLLGLSAQQLCHAWGLCLSMAGGSMQFSQESSGTTVKRLHSGYGALHGVMAAELAALGIDGPLQAFDGSYGLCRNFGSAPDIRRLLKDGGEPLEIHRISFKPYPCCRLFHSTLDALRQVTDDFSLAPAEIAAIRVGGPAIMVSQHMIRRPASVMAAQYSLPYTLAAALLHGPAALSGFSPEAMADADLLALAERVQAQEDAQMEASFPAHFGSWVELTTGAGARRRAEVLDSLGTPANPMSAQALVEKFDQLHADLPPAASGRQLQAAIATLKNDTAIGPLLALLQSPPSDSDNEE